MMVTFLYVRLRAVSPPAMTPSIARHRARSPRSPRARNIESLFQRALQASHAASADGKRAELAAVEHELARTSAATGRYLAAFENGSLDPEDLAPRLAHLKARTAQLHARHHELTAQIAAAPTAPPAATLLQVAEHIDDIIRSGTQNQRKALIETLVAQINITGPDRIVPVFRIPNPAHPNQDSRPQPPDERNSQATDAVRAMTNLVGPVGFEPTLPGT